MAYRKKTEAAEFLGKSSEDSPKSSDVSKSESPEASADKTVVKNQPKESAKAEVVKPAAKAKVKVPGKFRKFQ